VLASLVKDAKGRAARDADAGPAPGAFGFLTASCLDNQSVVYKAQVAMVVPKFAKIWSIMASTLTRRVTCLQLTERARARVQAVLQQPEAVWDEGTCAGAALSSLFIAGSCFDPASHAHDGAPCVIGSDTNQRARVPICLLSPLFGQLMVPPRYNVQL